MDITEFILNRYSAVRIFDFPEYVRQIFANMRDTMMRMRLRTIYRNAQHDEKKTGKHKIKCACKYKFLLLLLPLLTIGTSYSYIMHLRHLQKREEIHHFAGRTYLSSFLVSFSTIQFILHPKDTFHQEKVRYYRFTEKLSQPESNASYIFVIRYKASNQTAN